jgi:hypothetical protein
VKQAEQEMKNLILILAATLYSGLAHAENELVFFHVSGIEQACKRKDVSEPFNCNNNKNSPELLSVSLVPVQADQTEEMAFEGKVNDVGFILGSSQYLVDLVVRKTVSLNGKLQLYFVTFQAHKFSSNNSSIVYRTTVQINDELKLKEPILLPADRSSGNEKYFSQVLFQLTQP